MKRIILILFLCASVCLLSSCGTNATASSTSNDKNSQNQSSNLLSRVPSYRVYDLHSGNNEFDKAMNENPIDKSMQQGKQDPKVAATAVAQDFYKRYLDIWKSEVDHSVRNLKKSLSASESQALDTAQKSWEQSLRDNASFDNAIINDNGIYLGTYYSESTLKYAINQYRDRDFHLKYLTYLIEDSDQKGLPTNQWTWNKFDFPQNK